MDTKGEVKQLPFLNLVIGVDIMKTKLSTYNNLYRGKVVDNKDPKELCRIKVRIPCIHGIDENEGIKNDAIPYASPCLLDVSFDSGTFLVPEVGATVFVFFESGEPTKPVYFGCSVSYMYEEEAQYLGSKDSKYFTASEGLRLKDAGVSDTPFNVYQKGILRKAILYKSRKGSSIEFCDEDDNEHLSIYDRLGQTITMYSPVTPERNFYGQLNRGVFSILKNIWEVEKKAIMIFKSLSSSFLRFVSEKTYTKNEFITVYKNDKAGISVDIGQNDKMLIFYKDSTMIELKEDGITIKSNKVDIDADVNIKGSLKVDGEILSSSTIRGDVYGIWVHSNAQFPVPMGFNFNVDKYTDDKDEEIIQE
jgi:hypothetical protein